MHDLDGTACVELWAAGGFKIEDFPPGRSAQTMLDLHRARQRHLEVHWLLKALETHQEIPTAFADRLPEELSGDMPEVRLRIGDTYLVPNAAPAKRFRVFSWMPWSWYRSAWHTAYTGWQMGRISFAPCL